MWVWNYIFVCLDTYKNIRKPVCHSCFKRVFYDDCRHASKNKKLINLNLFYFLFFVLFLNKGCCASCFEIYWPKVLHELCTSTEAKEFCKYLEVHFNCVYNPVTIQMHIENGKKLLEDIYSITTIAPKNKSEVMDVLWKIIQVSFKKKRFLKLILFIYFFI